MKSRARFLTVVVIAVVAAGGPVEAQDPQRDETKAFIESMAAPAPAAPAEVAPPVLEAPAAVVPVVVPEVRPAVAARRSRSASAPDAASEGGSGNLRAMEVAVGDAEARVLCAPLMLCDVQLEAGEKVQNVLVGNPDEWTTAAAYSGDPESPVPHVVVRPSTWGASSNLLIATDRRTYHLRLQAPAKGSTEDLTAIVRFVYPEASSNDESGASWNAGEAWPAAPKAPMRPRGADVTNLSFDYSVTAKKRVPFVPSRVFDDGVHTYIAFPHAVRSGDAPALVVYLADGSASQANYRILRDGSWYVVDGIYQRLELVLGSGKRRSSVQIARRAGSNSAGGGSR